MRNKSRALNLDSRQDSVNDGGLGLADVLGNADAILGIGMDGIGNGLRSQEDLNDTKMEEPQMVTLKLKNADAKFARSRTKPK